MGLVLFFSKDVSRKNNPLANPTVIDTNAVELELISLWVWLLYFKCNTCDPFCIALDASCSDSHAPNGPKKNKS